MSPTAELPFAGRTVLVTGASSGIGRASALLLARQGAGVIVSARREDRARQTVEAVREAGGTAEFIAVDIASEASIDALFAEIGRRGPLHGAINNAATEGEPSLLPDMPVEEFDRVINTNVRGTWLCLRHETRLMRAQGRGSIVNVSSIAGVVGFARSSAYTTSKHAVVGMTRSAALDFAASGIRVNCLCPGGTTTEMSERWVSSVPGGEAVVSQGVPMKRFGKPDELAATAVFMLSDAAAYMTGAIIVVDGGSTAT